MFPSTVNKTWSFPSWQCCTVDINAHKETDFYLSDFFVSSKSYVYIFFSRIVNHVQLCRGGGDKEDRDSLCRAQWWSLFCFFWGGLGSWVRRERHMSAPAGALWDAPAGNAREGEEGVGESPHVVGVVKSMAKTQKENENISISLMIPWNYSSYCFQPGLYLDLWSLLLSLPNRSSATTSSWAERLPYLVGKGQMSHFQPYLSTIFFKLGEWGWEHEFFLQVDCLVLECRTWLI